MAWNFGDSFDLYTATADMIGYWDVGVFNSVAFPAGRFAGSQAIQWANAPNSLVKSSGVNDAVHHVVLAYRQVTTALGGTTLGANVQLSDGVTAQCSIVFRSDGAILLTSGGPTGTVLATYTGAVALINTWYAFEFEVKIDGAAGSFAVRKNGNTVNDFSATALNTRGGTSNNYANRLTIGMNVTVNAQMFDDLYWRSDASSVSWLGDIRCFTRMPASDVQAQFAKFPAAGSPVTQLVPASINSQVSAILNTAIKFTPFTAQVSGALTSIGVAISTGNSGNMKCAVYSDDGSGHPGAVLASANAPITPVPTGTATFAFSSGALIKGQQYWVAVIGDTNVGNYLGATTTAIGGAAPGTYSTFPLPNPVIAFGFTTQMLMTYAVTPGNWQAVSEPQQDGLTSYVFDSNPGDADFYSLSAIASTPLSVIATTVRAYMQKSDAGTRTTAVQLKSGATVVASPTQPLPAGSFTWLWRTDLVDPNTGAAWTAAAVTAAQIGPTVVA